MLSWDRKKIKDKEWEFESLDNFGDFDGFDCNNVDLNDFIQNDAELHKKELITETYCFRYIYDEGSSAPLGFISLANDTIPLGTNKQKRAIANDLRKYRVFPAVKIARLGVNSIIQGKSIGSQMVDLVKCLLTNHNRTGCRFLTVDAYNVERVLRFYKKNDFQFLDEEDKSDETRIMYYDLKTFAPQW